MMRASAQPFTTRIFLGEKIAGHYNLDPVRPGDAVVYLSTGTGEELLRMVPSPDWPFVPTPHVNSFPSVV